MKEKNSIQTNQEDMAGILQGAIYALGGRNGTTKLDILSYIKAKNPMLSYPNRHNLVFYLRRAINDAIDNNILQEANGKYKLVSAKRNHKRINKYRDVTERSRPGDRITHKRSRTSLTPLDNEVEAFNKEPEDKRRRHGKKRHGRRKGRRGGSRRRRRRYHYYAASDVVSNVASDAEEPKQVSSKSIQSPTSENEQISSNAGSDNLSSMDESNNSGSAESVPAALPPS